MSKIIRRAALAVAVSSVAIGSGAATASAATGFSFSSVSTSAKTVVSSKTFKFKLSGPTARSVTVTGTIAAAGVKVPIFDPKQYPGASSNVKQIALGATGVSLANQCATIRYELKATPVSGSAVTKSGTLSKASRCKALDAAATVKAATASRCEFVVDGAGRCLLPYPSNWYTKADATSATGRRVNFDRASTVATGTLASPGATFDPAEWNRNDGFSPTPKIVVHLPGLVAGTGDNPTTRAAIASNSKWPSIGSIGNFSLGTSSVVLVDKATGARVPVWAELDSTVTGSETPLLIHPAKALTEGHTYAVGLAGLKTASGAPVATPAAFKLYRDSVITNRAVVESRRGNFETIFSALAAGGVTRSNLQLAWDFTVSSSESLTGRMLAMRNDAFAKLGDTNLADLVPTGTSPAFTVDTVTTIGISDKIARRVEGTVTVPCYLTSRSGVPCAVGTVMNYAPGAGPDATPVQNGTFDLKYRCEIPKSAFTGDTTDGDAIPRRPVIYGHGLLGGRGEVGSDAQVDFANTYGYIYCATDEIGFASEDVATALGALIYLGNFRKMADRTQQGMLNELYLGRALVNSAGFRTNAAFQDSKGNSLIEGNRLFYDGNSQGGILGGLLTAIAPDFDRAVLGVNGMTYSTLLDRSTDFEGYLVAYKSSYGDALNRSLGLAMLQDIWDRAEPSGYVNRMTTNPLPNTPPHQVLMQVGLGDHQVHNITADTGARSIGASIHRPIVDAGRGGATNPGWNLPTITSYPFSGSALVYFDSGPVRSNGSGGWLGNTPPGFANVPPVEASGASGNDGVDPHEHPRRSATGRAMKASFLQINGKIIDACGGIPCYAGGWAGAPAP
ncbi:MAG: hypothetical protein WCO96_00250 [Actinomycetes bacterium]